MVKYFEIKIPSGASLSKLAKVYYSSVDNILKLNPNIKDRHKIQAGTSLKIPKIPKDKEPQAYKQAFDTGLKKLFKGDYGKEGAREKLLQELETSYPQIDVSIDIYSKIPDDWKIISPIVPLKEIKVDKKNWFDSISSFVSSKIVQPFRTEVQEAVFELAEYVDELPTFDQLLKLSGEKVKSSIKLLTSTWKDVGVDIPDIKIPEKDKPVVWLLPSGEQILKDVKDYSKLTAKMGEQKKFDRDVVIPFIEDLKMKEPISSFKVYNEKLLQKSLTEEDRLRLDSGYALKNLKSLEKDYKRIVNNAKLHGVTFLYDDKGTMIGFDEKKTLSEMEILINKKVEEQRISLEKIDPILSEANRRILENNSLQVKIIGMLNEEMTGIFEFLGEPENLETEKLSKFFKGLQDKFGSPTEFKNLDLAILELNDFRRTEGEFIQTSIDYQKDFKDAQDQLEKLITLPIESFFEAQSKLEELSEEENLSLQSFYEENKSSIDKIISLSSKIQGIIDWSDVNKIRTENLDKRAKGLESKISSKLEKVISYFETPEFVEGLTEYSVKTARPQTELLKVLKAFQENRIWYQQREDDIKKRTMGLDKNLKAAQQNINAYVEELNQINIDLFEVIDKLGKSQKNVQQVIYKEEKEAHEKQKKIMDAWLNPWKNRATVWANKKEVAFSAAAYIVPELIAPYIGFATKGILGAAAMLKMEKPVFKFFTWMNDEVWRKNLVPKLNAMIATIAVGSAQLGFEIGSFNMKYLSKDLTKEQKAYWKNDAWLVTMQELEAYWNFPVEEILATGTMIERQKKIIDFYRNPKAYEEMTLGKKTSIEDLIPKNRPTGQLILSIAALNPHIEDIFNIPAGTKIRIPRIDPLPGLSDVLIPRGVKVDWTLKHPVYLWMFDMFADIVVDPTSALWGSAMAATADTLKFVGEVPYKKISKLADKNIWALKAKGFFDFNSNMIRFLGGESVTKEFALKVPTLDRVRSNYLKLTIAKYLPYELRKGIKNMESDLAKISPLIKNVEIWEVIDSLPETSRKIIKKELLDAMSDPRKTPTDTVITFFKKFGMTGLDIWELNEKYPKTKEFLVKIIDAYVVSPDRAKFIAGMFNEKLLGSSEVAQDVFSQLIKSKGAQEIIDNKIKLRKLYTDRMDDVKKGFNLFSDYEKQTEVMRFLYKNSDEIINIPDGIKISEVKKSGLKTLGKEPFNLSVSGNKINIVYNPDAYKAGKLPQVISDAIYEPIIKVRLNNLDQSVVSHLKTSYQSTIWEAINPSSTKKHAITIPGGYEGPTRAVSSQDLLITSYFDDIKPRIKDQIYDYLVRKGDSLDIIAKRYYSRADAISALNPKVLIEPGSILRVPIMLDEILKIQAPDATKEISFKYSYKRPWEDVIAERAEEGNAAQFARIVDKKEIVTKYNTVTSYLSRASALDWLRIDNLDLYVWFKKYINSLDPDTLAKSSDLALTKFIFNMDSLRLTDFQKILLLGDDISSRYKKIISSDIKRLTDSFASKYNKKLLSSQRTKLIGEGLEEWQIKKELKQIQTIVEIRPEAIDEISKIKSWTAPNLKKIELKRILPQRHPYLAEIPKQGEAMTEAILLKQNEMKDSTLKLIRDLEEANGSDILKIQQSFTKDLKESAPDLIYFPTTLTDSAKISSKQMSEIMAADAKGKTPILYNVSRKDKELIKFLNQHKIPYQELKVPSRLEMFTKTELIQQLENLNLKAYLSKGIISDDGILRLLEKSFIWPVKKIIKTKAGRVMQAPLDTAEQIWFGSKYESFRNLLKDEHRKSIAGRSTLKKISKEGKASSHTIELNAEGEIWYRKRTERDILNIQENIGADYFKNWAIDYEIAMQRLGLKSLNLIIENGKILNLKTNFELKGLNEILQEKALRMAKGDVPSTFRRSILPEINIRILEKKLFEGISLEAETFLAKLINVFDPSPYSNKNAWLKATDSIENISRLKAERSILSFDLRDLKSKLSALKSRILNINSIKNLAKRPERKFAFKKALKDLPIKAELVRESGRLTARIKIVEDGLDRVGRKLRSSEGTLDDFLSATGSVRKFPYDLESEFLQLARNKKAIGLEFIQNIDSRLSGLKKILAKPLTIEFMKGVSFESLQREVKRLEGLREIATPWKVAEANKILPTFDEIWEAWKGIRSEALNKKLKKFSNVYENKRKLTGTPLILNEFKDAKYQVPEIIIKTKKAEDLAKTYLVGDMFAKDLPEIQIVNFEAFKVQETISELKRLEELGIKIVIDESGLLKSMVSNVPFKFTIVTIDELLPNKLRFLSLEKNAISSPGEVKGMLELRNIFWDSKKIAIVGLDNRPNILKELFYNRYLGDLEKTYLDAAWTDTRRLSKLKGKTYPGPTFIFSRTQQFEEAGKAFKKVLTPVETIEKIYPQVEKEIARHDLRKYLENTDWIKKRVEDVDPFRGGKVLVIAQDKTFLERGFKNLLEEGIQRKVEFFFPDKMNRGELSAADFLRARNISITEIPLSSTTIQKLFTGLDEKLPFFLMPSAEFGMAGKRALALDGFQNRNRIIKTYKGMQQQFAIDYLEQIKRWTKDRNKVMPSVLRDEVVRGKRDVVDGLARWFAMIDRNKIKEWWEIEKVRLIENAEYVARQEIMAIEKRNFLEPWESKGVKTMVSRWAHTLDGLDQEVFKWNRGQGLLERMRAKLANDFHYTYLKKADAYGLGPLPIEISKGKRAQLFLMEKAFWDIPQFLKAPRVALQWGRSFWINMVLFWRVGWHIWNSLDDALRASIKARNMKLFFEIQGSYWDATVKFLKDFGGDTAKLMLETTGFYKAAPGLKKETLKLLKYNPEMATYIWKTIDETQKANYFKAFNLDDYYKAKKTGVLGYLQENLYRKNLREIMSWENASTKLPSGEIMKPDDVRFLASSGISSMLEDPLFVNRRLGFMAETTFFQRVNKRFAVLDADIKLYSNVMEELRRLQLAHNLLFKKAMKLSQAEASVKKWMFDYRDLTAAGQFFRNFFPFYTFNAKAIQLYFDLSLQQGYRTYLAAKTLMRVWSEVTRDLPPHYQNRIPVGGEVYWAPGFSIFSFFLLLTDPIKAVQEFIENPLRTIGGFGWDPFLASTIEALQGKGYFTLSRHFKENLGWTPWEIENYWKEQKQKDDLATNSERIWEFMFQFIPFGPAIKSLAEVDEAMIMREIPLMNSKVIREWLKFFGLNIRTYDDLERLRYVYFDLPPNSRSEWVQELKAENPDLYKIWREYFIISQIVKIQNAKGMEKIELLRVYEAKWHIDTFYSLEDNVKGTGYDWLNRNSKAKAYLDLHLKGEQLNKEDLKKIQKTLGLSEEQLKMVKDDVSLALTPWRMAARDKHKETELKRYVTTYLDSIPSGMTQEKIDRLDVLGLNVYSGAFDKQELRNDLFDKYGNVIPLSLEEVNIILKDKKWLEKGLEEIGPEVIMKADELFLQWQMMSSIAKKEKKYDDALYYHRLSIVFAVLPKGLENLVETEQVKYWNEFRKTFDRVLTDEQKVRYETELPEVQKRYLEAMELYIKTWQKIFSYFKEEDFDFFKIFYDQPKWFQELYFLKHRNKATWYPFAQEWIGMLQVIKKKEGQTGEFLREERKVTSKFFWKKENRKARLAWDKDNPGFLRYMNVWKEIFLVTEEDPEKYFDLFFNQPKWFQDRFFKANPEKKLYYSFVRKWTQFIELDEKNWNTKGVKTELAKNWFWSKKNLKARNAYGKANPIIKDKNIIDYLRLWQGIIEITEELPDEYFSAFYSQPKWFIEHFFKNNPNKEIYYPFARELGKQKSEDFSSFFWAAKYRKQRLAWEKDKLGYLVYMNFWRDLSKYAEVGNWNKYFEFYYASKNKEYRERHWRNNPSTKISFALFRDYSLMPSMTWEDRRAKRIFLEKNPKLLEWWKKDLSESEAVLREKVEHYFKLLDNIKADGIGRSYFLDYRKWKLTADRFLQMNPDVLLFLERKPNFYTGEKAEIFTLISEYEALVFPEQKRIFLKDHSELSNYFLNSNPPGIRRILKLQTEYFTLSDNEKTAFLEKHSELKEWWEITKLPWSYYFAPEKFRIFENTISKVEKAFALFRAGKWDEAETVRLGLSNVYTNPGISEEDDWFKNKVYRSAMETWIQIIDQNELMAVYFFRQLPRWLRDQYYTKHPDKRYLSTEPLARFIEEPLRVWSSLNTEVSWAFNQHYKYGKNMPYKIQEKVRKIFLKYGIWKTRANWTQRDWDDYWVRRSLKLNDLKQSDLEDLPLLRAELKKVIKTFPLRVAPKIFGKPRIGIIQPFF